MKVSDESFIWKLLVVGGGFGGGGQKIYKTINSKTELRR